jgi:hypothetical protein
MSFLKPITDFLSKYKEVTMQFIKRSLGPIMVMFGFGHESDWDLLVESLVKLVGAVLTVLGNIDVVISAAKMVWQAAKDVANAFTNIFKKKQ